VIAISEVGKGRAMAVTTDATWRWSFDSVARGGTSRPYNTFWNAATRWLIKDPELKLINVDIEEATVAPGAEVPVTVRVARPDYTPAVGVEGQIEVRRKPLEVLSGEAAPADQGDEVVLTQPFTTDDRGRTTITLPDVRSGAWSVRALARTEAGELRDEDLFLVTLDSQELRSISPRPDLLQALSEATEGEHHLLPALERDPALQGAPRHRGQPPQGDRPVGLFLCVRAHLRAPGRRVDPAPPLGPPVSY
jgi:hypothetical protein